MYKREETLSWLRFSQEEQSRNDEHLSTIEDVIDCDVFLSRIKALQSIAKRELDNSGFSDYLLMIAKGIVEEANNMATLLAAKVEV